jgi:uroporphyrinogen decarboxylase
MQVLTQTVMTSRERVMRVLRRQEPDRVPVGYSGNAGINARLMKHFGLPENDWDGLARALEVDDAGCNPWYCGPRLHAEIPGRHVSPDFGIRTRWIEHASGGYWDFCDFPLAEANDETIANWPIPNADLFNYDRIPAMLAQAGDRAVFVGHAGLADIMNSTGMLFGQEAMLINLATEHEPMLGLIDRRLDLLYEVTRRTLEMAGGRIDFMWLGEDLGSQRGPLISLEMFRRLIRPRHQRFVDLAKQHGIPVMIHSCGSSSWAYEDFTEMGISAVDTLQPEALNMSPAYLKSTYGSRLAFHGAISTAGLLAHGTVEQVEEEVRETLRVYMPGGGYFLAPTHSIQDDTPTENVLAMYAAARKYGRY